MTSYSCKIWDTLPKIIFVTKMKKKKKIFWTKIFSIFQNNTSEIIAPLPYVMKKKFLFSREANICWDFLKWFTVFFYLKNYSFSRRRQLFSGFGDIRVSILNLQSTNIHEGAEFMWTLLSMLIKKTLSFSLTWSYLWGA
jgi:hypothetical protein